MLEPQKATAKKRSRRHDVKLEEIKGPSFRDEMALMMKDSAFRQEFESVRERMEIAEAMIRARVQAKMTQEDLAKAMETKQSAIARLESGKYDIKVSTLKKFAKVLGLSLRISFVKG